MNKPSLNALTRLVGRARVLPVLVVVTTAASVEATAMAWHDSWSTAVQLCHSCSGFCERRVFFRGNVDSD